MQTLCSEGCSISLADKKALEEYLLQTPKEWAQSALDGMINKSIKTIFKDWFLTYKSTQSDTIPADLSIIIPGIIAMPEFKPYNIPIPPMPQVMRKQTCDQEIWSGGFDVEDYKKQALDAYYADPEAMLRFFMENKIYERKKAFTKTYEEKLFNDPEVTEIPTHVDDLIDLIISDIDYKNRSELEQES